MAPSIDSPQHNDNREYRYTGVEETARPEYGVIVSWISEEATVLDLGCGDGSLLSLLKAEKHIRGTGIERSPSGVQQARKRGLDVFEGSIDRPLNQFKDDQFDVAVCNVTIQMVLYPEVLLREMKRVARYQIISFPNHAFYPNRLDLLLSGRVPRPSLFGYSWYNTGHLHPLSIRDFYQLLEDVKGLRIMKHHGVQTGNILKRMLVREFPNLFQAIPVFQLKKI